MYPFESVFLCPLVKYPVVPLLDPRVALFLTRIDIYLSIFNKNCSLKGSPKRMKRQATDWKKTLANHIFDQGLVSQIDKDLSKSGNRNAVCKSGQDIWTSHVRRYVDDKRAQEKIHDTISHLGNAN